MRKIVLLFFMFSVSNAFANDYDQKLQDLMRNPINCTFYNADQQTDPVTLFYWDGDCKNGYIDGPGMVLYKRKNNNYPGRYMGQFTQGTMEKQTIWMLTVMTNEGKHNDFKVGIISGSTTLYGTWDKDPFFSNLPASKNWVKNTNVTAGPDKEQYIAMSYQDVLKSLENDFNRLKPTMSFYKFKSYLENPWNDGWSGPKLSTANSKNLQDDPAVAGITLSLGGANKPTKKSKKK